MTSASTSASARSLPPPLISASWLALPLPPGAAQVGRQRHALGARDMGEIRGRKGRAVAQNDRAEHGVFELAHVAGPGVVDKHGAGLVADAPDLLGFERGKTLNEMLDQKRDIAGALAQGRDMQREHVDAVIEILAERAFPDHLEEVAVGCGNQADVDVD